MSLLPNGLKIVDGSTRDYIPTGDADAEEYAGPESVLDVSRPPEPRGSRKGPPKAAPADKPVDALLTQTELRKSLCSVYNLVNRLLHVDTRYRPDDWSEEADGLMGLINQFARLRVIGRFLGPIAAMGAAWDKVDDTMTELRAKRAAKKQTIPPAVPQSSIDLTAQPVGANGKAAFKS